MTQIELYQTSLPVSESILGKLEGTRCATARTAGSTAVYCSYCWQYSSILSYCWQYSSILPVLLLLLLLLTSCRCFRGSCLNTFFFFFKYWINLYCDCRILMNIHLIQRNISISWNCLWNIKTSIKQVFQYRLIKVIT